MYQAIMQKNKRSYIMLKSLLLPTLDFFDKEKKRISRLFKVFRFGSFLTVYLGKYIFVI